MLRGTPSSARSVHRGGDRRYQRLHEIAPARHNRWREAVPPNCLGDDRADCGDRRPVQSSEQPVGATMALCHVEKAPDLRRAGQRNDIDRPGRQLIDKCQDRLVSDVRGVFVGRYRIGNGARALKKGDKPVASAGVKLHADSPTAQIKAGKQREDALRRRLFRAQLRLLPQHPQRSDRLGAAADRAGSC